MNSNLGRALVGLSQEEERAFCWVAPRWDLSLKTNQRKVIHVNYLKLEGLI